MKAAPVEKQVTRAIGANRKVPLHPRFAICTSTKGLACAQSPQLWAVLIEVGWIEPTLEGLLAGGPFMVEHGKPGGVAIAVLDDHVLAENAFERKTETEGGSPARFVLGVALP